MLPRFLSIMPGRARLSAQRREPASGTGIGEQALNRAENCFRLPDGRPQCLAIRNIGRAVSGCSTLERDGAGRLNELRLGTREQKDLCTSAREQFRRCESNPGGSAGDQDMAAVEFVHISGHIKRASWDQSS
jgi:hypothetical protein